jgi:hypothetical protein
MTPASSFKKDVFKVFLLALLSLFLFPLIASLFVQYAEPQRDATYLVKIEQAIDKNGRLSDKDKQDAKSFFRANPSSSTCDNDSPDLAKYRANVCAPYTELWQFHAVHRVSFWTLVGGLLVLVAVLTLGAAAFVNCRAQYFSFVLGWNLLTLVSGRAASRSAADIKRAGRRPMRRRLQTARPARH